MTLRAPRRFRKGRVLFMSHAAERTGPPIIMLHLARWLRANTDLDFELLFLQGGELEEEFRSLARVWILDEWDPPRPAVVLDSLAWKFGLERHAPMIRTRALRWRMRRARHFDLVYVNTAGSVRPLRYLPLDDPIVLTHVHELSVGLDFHLPPEDRELISEVTRHYIAVSDAVARETERAFGAAPDAITRQYGFIELPPEDAPAGETAALRRSLGIPEDAAVVGAAGLTHWRKAPDLFVALAQMVHRRLDRRVVFVWLGGNPDSPVWEAAHADRARADLEDVVHFVGEQPDPIDWLRALDLFVLPSREDAYPLVCLEAASVGVPTVCFATGGIADFVAPDGEEPAGAVVPYPDLVGFVAAVEALLTDPDERRRRGEVACRRVTERHAVAVGAQGLLDDLREVVARA